MKKLSYICMMALFAVFFLNSCGGTDSGKDQKIADKIANKETLSPEDYTRMIEYVGEYAEKAQNYAVGQSEEDSQKLSELTAEYPHLDAFRNCIKATPLDKFSASDVEIMQKYAGLVEFSAPDGFQIQTNPKAAGMEVAAPDSANGVIAGAVDSLVVK